MITGHALGLDHVEHRHDSVMYPRYDRSKQFVKLGDYDIELISALYQQTSSNNSSSNNDNANNEPKINPEIDDLTLKIYCLSNKKAVFLSTNRILTYLAAFCQKPIDSIDYLSRGY